MATEVSKRPRREVATTTAETLVDVENAFLADADVYATDDNLYVLLDIPGVEKGDVQIEVDETNTLQVRARNSFQEHKRIIYREFEVGDFYRSFRLGEEYDKEKITARLEHGVLEITVPKREEAKPRRISINA